MTPERERPVEVVEPVGCPLVVGEEQQPQRHLGDEQGLAKGEEMGVEAVRLAAPPQVDEAECERDAVDDDHE